MSLPHFFLQEQVLAHEAKESFSLRLDADDMKHARALRLAAGEHIAVIDADQDYFECRIERFDGRSFPEVSIAGRPQAPKRAHVTLVQGLAKGDKMDDIIRHATEIGVSSFLPLTCERSIVRLDEKKAEARQKRWQAIAKSAAMQSGQLAVPQVSAPQTIASVCSSLAKASAVLVCWEEADLTARISRALHLALSSAEITDCSEASIAVVVGPEGGFSRGEVDRLLCCNPRAFAVTLGPSVLRTETAGMLAPALVFYELER